VRIRPGADRARHLFEACDIDGLLAEAAKFYGPSIDFSRVKVTPSKIALGGRPWTANGTIRLPDTKRPEGCPPQATIVHELAHVWQYQNGNLQLLRGLVEQISNQFGRNPYDYGGAAGVEAAVRSGASLLSFSNESQAQIIEDYWSSVHGSGETGYGGERFTAAYVQAMQVLVSDAGIGTRPPAGANPIERAVGWVVNAGAGVLEVLVGSIHREATRGS
jgi:hypothetical protein